MLSISQKMTLCTIMEWPQLFILWLRIRMWKVSRKVGNDKEKMLHTRKEQSKDKDQGGCITN